MLRFFGLLFMCMCAHASQYEDSQFLDYLSMLDNQMTILDKSGRKDKYNDRFDYNNLFANENNADSYDEKLDELMQEAYLDAVYKSLKKRAEMPVPSPKCTQRSNIIYPTPSTSKVTIRFPAISPRKPDQYMCTTSKIPFNGDTSYVVKYTPHASADRAHHMLVYGCEGEMPTTTTWNCGMGTICGNHKQHSIWAWARNAPGLKLPKDVGFELGTRIKYLVMQIHYKVAFTPDETDCSGVTLDVTKEPQKYLAGIYLMGAGLIDLPPHSKNVSADAACVDELPSTFTVFAFRTHAHARGNVITAYRYRPSEAVGNRFKMVGKGNPKWPESFYPRVGGSTTIKPDDALYARCIYSNPTNREIFAGSTHNDEMCNFYMMYYTADRSVLGKSNECWGIERKYNEQLREVYNKLPADMNTLAPYPGYAGKDSIAAIAAGTAVKPAVPSEHIHGSTFDQSSEDHELTGHSHEEMPANQEDFLAQEEVQEHPIIQEDTDKQSGQDEEDDLPDPPEDAEDTARSRGHGYKDEPPVEDIKAVPDWLDTSEFIGQVGGVAIDDRGFVHVFHRSHRVWGAQSFNNNNIYQHQNQPINNDTIFKLDPESGKIVHQWGRGQFFMPHGATVDRFNNLWLTDVAMHQVFKYPLDGAMEPTFVLGERFVQGNDASHFCKPTSTAVDKKGYLYVADGYCNGRVVKFSPDGVYVTEWGKMVTARQMISGSPPPPGVFNVVHSVALTTNDSEIWIADRENGRIQCYTTNGKFLRIIQDKQNIGGKIFAISFSENKNGLIHGVNNGAAVVEGFTIDYHTHEVVNKWGVKQISNPHAIACYHDGTQMYVGQLSGTRLLKFVNNEVVLPPGDTLVPFGAFMHDQPTAEKKSTTDQSSTETEDKIASSKFVLDDKPADSSNDDTASEVDDTANNLNDKGIADSAVKSKTNDRGPIIAVISILLVLPTVIIISAFICVKMRQRRLSEYHGLLSRSSSASKYSDASPKRRGKPSINLGKFFKKSPDKAGFSQVRTEADSDEDGDNSDSDVELFKKDVEAAEP